MRAQRMHKGRLLCSVESFGDEVTISNGGQDVDITLDDLRWLASVGAPTIICALAKVPSDALEKVASPDDGQIKGQTTIEEMLA